MAEPDAADLGEGQAAVLRLNVRPLPFRHVLAEDGGGAFFKRHGDEPVPVGLIALDGDEQIAGLRRAGIEADAPDLQIRVRSAGKHLGLAQEFFELHAGVPPVFFFLSVNTVRACWCRS